MKNRNLPFGYCYENGTVCVNKSEAKILDQIFDYYIGGMSLLKIAEKLNNEKVAYMPGVTGWNKARLMRIIEDKRYLGNDSYPAVITKETHEELKRLKCRRNTQKDTDRTADIFNLNLPVLCPNCGCEMHRRHDTRCKVSERWTCRNNQCKTLIIILKQICSDRTACLRRMRYTVPPMYMDGTRSKENCVAMHQPP